jgi:hypothetical protein
MAHTAGMTTSTAPTQLPLLAEHDVPVQFRLNERTRRLGLANIASIKAQLAQQEARRLTRTERAHPARAA